MFSHFVTVNLSSIHSVYRAILVYTKEYATIFRDSSVHMHKITIHLAPVIINYQLCHIAIFVEGAVHLPTKAIALQCYTYVHY